ncbi:2'-5' RNA ligase family protein [Halofilum ochraceum]|uniref:2'-5' RNA ligase family protein n=1 Tax=Halofilum ochraceum TaxID=1611323 RepID=UPI0008DAC633|nr:2'-5' RNA ligase family protein [Halofilum ochraceum]
MEANWFIALPFPPESLPREELQGLPAGTRAFEPADLHVTVTFLGAVGERCAREAWRALDIREALPLSATIGPRALFGSPRRPSALGLDLDPDTDDSALTGFIAEWRNELRTAAGLAPEQRPVRPHVTLGRPPRRTDAAWQRALAAWIDRPAAHAPATFERIALYTRAEPGDRRRFREVCSCPTP